MGLCRRILFFACALALLLCITTSGFDINTLAASNDFRAVWVATVFNIDYPTKAGLSVDALKKEAIDILDNVKSLGLNAVILQVRPASDAFYKSSLFPWSQYLTGTQGKAPASGFDPLKFWVDEAHKRGLKLHAWINPFRVSLPSAIKDVSGLSSGNPARKNPSWVKKYTNNGFYFDPGIPEVRKLVIDGVKEIVTNYEVDGVHFDDYFYPGTDFDDSASYAKYGGGKDKGDWRRENINALVRETHDMVSSLKQNVDFGVSPGGIWAGAAKMVNGSATTSTFESYYVAYADSRRWVKEGWLDYIAPQLYWGIGSTASNYSALATWWNDVAAGTGVKLYTGLAAYKEGDKTQGAVWADNTSIISQLKYNEPLTYVSGSIFFSYKSIIKNEVLYSKLKNYYSGEPTSWPDSPPLPPTEQSGSREKEGVLAINTPGKDIATSLSNYYIMGSSNPSKPLYINGKEVKNRSNKGYFGILVPINKTGSTTITVKQGDETVTRVFSRPTGGGSTSAPKAAITNAWPYQDEYRPSGRTVTFKCTAPVGAKVTVTLAGKAYTLKPAKSGSATNPVTLTTYTYDYKIPTYKDGQVVLIGKPTYKMTYAGSTKSLTASGIYCLNKNGKYYIEVTNDYAFLYNGASTSGGSVGELAKGMKDYVVETNGDWVKLSMGKWVNSADVRRYTSASSLRTNLSNAKFTVGDKWETMSFSTYARVTASIENNGKTLTFTVYNTYNMPGMPKLPQNSIVAKAEGSFKDYTATYKFTAKEGEFFDGAYTEIADGNILRLNIKRHPKVDLKAAYPLAGLTIMLDPGHGGDSPGAYGPLGSAYAEKYANIDIARMTKSELEALGAIVKLTRETDVDISLTNRVDLSRKARPDLFLSIHLNALDEDKDSSNLSGAVVLYLRNGSKSFADLIYNSYSEGMGMKKQGIRAESIYVCRPDWTPSVLLETGFINNPVDFTTLTTPESQAKAAKEIARAILKYFAK